LAKTLYKPKESIRRYFNLLKNGKREEKKCRRRVDESERYRGK
jgi:hypothetical protein